MPCRCRAQSSSSFVEGHVDGSAAALPGCVATLWAGWSVGTTCMHGGWHSGHSTYDRVSACIWQISNNGSGNLRLSVLLSVVAVAHGRTANLTGACISPSASSVDHTANHTADPAWPPQTATEHCRKCMGANSKSQHREDHHVLPELWNASGHRPGTFVEFGAFDGVRLSSTYLFDYQVLIEASSTNFDKLRKSGRAGSTLVHSAVCKGPPSTVRLSVPVANNRDAGQMAGQTESMSPQFKRLFGRTMNGTEEVPCRSLTAIMADAGYERATFLSLDVEGAEDLVLHAVDPRAFRLVLVEWEAGHDEKNKRVHNRLISAGMQLHGQWQSGRISAGGRSRVYVAPDSGIYPRGEIHPLHGDRFDSAPEA